MKVQTSSFSSAAPINAVAQAGAVRRDRSMGVHLIGWFKARAADVVVAAETLHDIQWNAPWDDQSGRA